MVMIKKFIKPAKDGHIINTFNFKPTKVQKKLINYTYKKIMDSKYKCHYNGTYHTQTYDLKYILSKIICFIHNCHTWRSLGNRWNNIYSHLQKLRRWNIFNDSFEDLLKKYTIKRAGRHLKVVMVDISIILNKYGSDLIKRNYLVKNKFCTKILTIVDDKGIPLYIKYDTGSKNDGKSLIEVLDDFLEKTPDIVSFLADSGFYTKAILNTLKKHNVTPIIAKNIRNTKKDKKYVNNSKKNKKITFEELIERQTEDFTNSDKRKFKKRHKVENVYANLKQKPRFNIRYDRFVKNLYNLTLIYFCEQILKHI